MGQETGDRVVVVDDLNIGVYGEGWGVVHG